ncbi:DUF262 domain-containing protein [Nitrosomonas sp. Nm166]|uniref:DUF262 domain-containing protein n=1 Tax=Nitrosomonas sp. Nm166 TaxID=1881054 RepID=UPI0008F2595C|nr:DUF262 domain-containing protein [Nitrosomonas sp. Nm166]SFF03326.1 Uncharacterized conserved protein, contains ParB-like and HNH nuclease domains [Nitrosomonas sp. Nm166]
MKNQKQTIRKIVGFLNNSNEGGGFWLPNIQRPFVWSEEQICRLFDSILREYPISTLLIWKTTSSIRRRKFIDNWADSLRLSDYYVPENYDRKNLVLDGQQRLQSLFIGLCGSFNEKELHIDILSGEIALPEDIKYQFKFLNKTEANFPWILFKDLIFTERRKREVYDLLKSKAGRSLTLEEEDKLNDHLDLIDRTFKMEEAIVYQELDSIDNPSLYTEEDVVEVFIRTNSGGTKLGKSDLLFSLLSSTWEVADKKMEDLLDDLNRHGFAFDRDFVLKTCLVLLDQGARYEVSKFRKQGVRECIESKWENISDAIRDVVDFIRSKTYIQCDKALPSYLALIPLIYVRYHFIDAWKKANDINNYLLRTLLVGAFSGKPDNLIDALVNKFKEIGGFSLEDAYSVMRSQGRSLELTEDRFLQMGYGSQTIHLLFNLWYPTFTHVPVYNNNLPQIDHIFPISKLMQIKVVNQTTGRQVMKYPKDIQNQLANCMLLTREENGNGGKSDSMPEDWFTAKSIEYLDLHLIPKEPALWKMDCYTDFIEARKELIKDRFKFLLI